MVSLRINYSEQNKYDLIEHENVKSNSRIKTTLFDLPEKNKDSTAFLAKKILKIIFEHRRLINSNSHCDSECFLCQVPHLSKLISTIEKAKPIQFILPAFPGKSPNLNKVLGTLPDMAEILALKFLNDLCEKIEEVYSYGANIIVCSDGRVFSDLIGIAETDVTAYQHELSNMISTFRLKNIFTFNLDDRYSGIDIFRARHELMQNFGTSAELLKEKVRRGAKVLLTPQTEEISSSDHSQSHRQLETDQGCIEAHRMYCGITRFLVEDAYSPGQIKSRTVIQKECKVKSYEVIRRSNAWSELLSQEFPCAVRLSIHPQNCGSKKIGIRLVGTEAWMTPWHGVAVKKDNEFILLKRSAAEAQGGRLVTSPNGRPSHYELPNSYSKAKSLQESEAQS